MFFSTAKLVALLFCGAYLSAQGAAWFVLVPETISVSTYVLTSTLTLILMSIGVWTMTAAQATRSVAHLLYDVEHSDYGR